MMPANVRAGQIVSLVEITGGLGSRIDIPRLADEFSANIETLLPILDTGEILGLVRTEKGDVFLTDFGLKFQKTSKNKIRLLKDVLSKIEPFKTALDICAAKGFATSHEIASSLEAMDVRWHHSPELNEALIQALLIHWAIYAGLLTYDGRNGRFEKKATVKG
jgi:hypothetical protein